VAAGKKRHQSTKRKAGYTARKGPPWQGTGTANQKNRGEKKKEELLLSRKYNPRLENEKGVRK